MPDALPSLGQMLADQIAGVDPAEAEARLEKANGALLWGEPTPHQGLDVHEKF